MAVEDTKGKKRKGASDSAPKAKKARKSADIAPKPVKAAINVPMPVSKPVKATRKTAVDFFSDDEPTKDVAKPVKSSKKGKAAVATNGDAPEPMEIAVEAPKAKEKPKKGGKKGKAAILEEELVVEAPIAVEAPKEKATKAKRGKKTESAPLEEDATAGAQEEAPVKKSKKAKGSKKQAEPVEEVAEVEVISEEVDGEAEEDDQTAALLAGFESDDDDKDPEDDNEFDADAPTPNLSKKDQTALEKALKSSKSTEPGVVYIGRVPRGFFEAEMKKYFSQFGRVNRLRLSRNKKTGASKHYAFVEFQSSEVADIVARTMNNYLLFGHILKVNLIPAEQVHPELFKGAGERFKVDPRNKKAGLQMERGVDRAQWAKRVENETKRRKGRSKALLEEYGYEYEAPAVKGVDSIPKQLENGEAQQIEAPIEEASVEEAPVAQPKAKKGKKAKTVEALPIETTQPIPEKKGRKARSKLDLEADVQAEIAAEVAAPTPEKKTKKDKKRKSDVAALETTTTTITTVEEAPVADLTPKSKRAKKEPKVVEEEVVVEKKVTKPKKAKKAKA